MDSDSQKRSTNYLNQVKSSFPYKLGAIVATFITVPITIKYLGIELYGIWATMLTFITWVMLFDLGIGHGLKNKLSESLAKKDKVLASGYISTAYVVVGVISLILFLCFYSVSYFISWQVVFNSKIVEASTFNKVMILLFAFIFLNFWLSLITQVYHGLQRSSTVVLGQLLSNGLILLSTYFLYFFTERSIINVVFVYGVCLILSNSLLSLIVFKKKSILRPSISRFDYKKLKPLLGLGIKFFVIQLSVLLVFMTDKILIAQLIGPSEVTSYDVLFKLFSMLTILHTLILNPLWPAYSNAHAKGDFYWIRSQISKQIVIALLIFILAIFFSIFGPFFISVWIDSPLDIKRSLYYLFALYIIVSVWNNVFAYFVNAVGLLKIQLCTAILAAFLNIPLSIYFVKIHAMGLNGVLLATIFSLSIYAIAGPIHVYIILFKKNNYL